MVDDNFIMLRQLLEFAYFSGEKNVVDFLDILSFRFLRWKHIIPTKLSGRG